MRDSLYGGIFIIDLADKLENSMVLATSDSNHPNDVKAVGGMGLAGESPQTVAHREAGEEARTKVLESTLVFIETSNGHHGRHVRFFFLADKIVGGLAKGAVCEVEEKDPEGRVVEKLTTRWVPLLEFADRLFYRQHPAFGAVLSTLAARDKSLLASHDFCKLTERFPEPENLGFEDETD